MPACRFAREQLVLRGTDIPPGWTAYLATAKAFSLVNAFGQGYAIDREPDVWQYAGPRRYVYIFDPASGAAFSPTWLPVLDGVSEYKVRMAPAEVTFRAVGPGGAGSLLRATVDPETGAECWELTLTNRLRRKRLWHVVVLVPFLERRGFGARCSYHPEHHALVSHVTPFFASAADYERIQPLKRCSFLAADRAPEDFCGALRRVLPLDELASRPPFLKTGRLGGHEALAELSCGALLFRLALPAGGNETLRWALGAVRDAADVGPIAARLRDAKPFAAAHAEWSEWDAGLRATLPDKNLEAFLNTFAKHQVRMNCVTARWSQNPTTRNWLLDWEGAAWLRPAEALAAFRAALRAQKQNGFVPQGFTLSPFARLVDAQGLDYRDGPVWCPPAALTLLEVLGDPSFLHEKLPYADGGEATAFAHLHQGLRFLAERRGSHGLVLFGEGDWNDQINNAGRLGRGESTWLSFAFIHACRAFEEICRWTGDASVARETAGWADEVTQAVNAHAWDGRWYNRGFLDDGRPFGIAAEDEGRIYLEPQAWALLAHAVPPERLGILLASIRRELLTPYGVRLLRPPYRRWRPELGRITVDLPGNKENGSAYCHGTLFYAAGLFEAGRADEAVAQLQAVLPTNPRHPYARSGQHPAYIPNAYMGPEAGAAHAGRGSNHNWTGSAPWFVCLCLRQLLGVRGTPRGVRLAPQLPSAWKEARLALPFRGAKLEIAYRRAARPGVRYAGRLLAGDELTGIEPGRTYEVEVRLRGQRKLP